MLERWFDRLLRDGMALTLAGDYAPFPEVAEAALRTLTRGEISTDAVEHVLVGDRVEAEWEQARLPMEYTQS